MTIKNILVKITLIVTATLLIQMPLFADVYKWIDKNGQVNYSDQAQNPSAKRLSSFKTRTKKSISQNNSEPAKAAKTEEGNETTDTSDKDKKAAKEKKPTISKKEKRRLCNEGRDDYKKISSRGRVREISKKGEYTYLTEKQRQKRLAAAKKKQRKYCR